MEEGAPDEDEDDDDGAVTKSGGGAASISIVIKMINFSSKYIVTSA